MKNRTLGSILIVAGTTIGAGMLAMPLASAGVGFGVTGITDLAVGADVLYRPAAAGSLSACPCGYGVRLTGGALSRPLRPMGHRFLYAFSDVCAYGGLYQRRWGAAGLQSESVAELEPTAFCRRIALYRHWRRSGVHRDFPVDLFNRFYSAPKLSSSR